jgi:large subunit ribosomal protein L5
MRLSEKYLKEVAPVLASEFKIKNKFAIPKIEKVVVNVGSGQTSRDKAKMEKLREDVAIVTGQAPSQRRAKLSIAGFNVREGMVVGLKVTLRGERKYDFLTRLTSIVLPRLRDFRGVPGDNFDKNGNYTLGIIEHSVFPEIDVTKSGSHGMEMTVVIKNSDPIKSKRLLELLGMPFEKSDKQDAKSKS